MLKNTLIFLSIVLFCLSAFFGISAGWFEYSSRLRNSIEDKKQIRGFYERLWHWIDSNYLIHLPLLVIIKFLNFVAGLAIFSSTVIVGRLQSMFSVYVRVLNLKSFYRRYIRKTSQIDFLNTVYKLTFLEVIVTGASTFILFSDLFNYAITTALVICVLFLENRLPLVKRNAVSPYQVNKSVFEFLMHWLIWLLQLAIVFIRFFGVFYGINLVLTLDIYIASIILLSLTPVFSYLFGNAVLDITTAFTHYFLSLVDNSILRKLEDRWMLSGLSISLSIILTILSFVIGHLLCATCDVDINSQLLISNILFDNLTLFTTIALLEQAVPLINRKSKKWNIGVVIILDLLLAAVFAILSLYFGLLNTDKELSILQVSKVLLGASPQDNGALEFGPLFWAMHTTFIPTLIYLFIIVMATIGKMVIMPANRLLFKGALAEDPYHLTAGFFGLFAVIFTMLSLGIDKFIKLLM